MSDALSDFIHLAAPWAEAVLAVAKNLDEVEGLEQEARGLEARISKLRATALSLKAEADKHTTVAVTANTSAKEAEAARLATLDKTQKLANDIIASAQAEARRQADEETAKRVGKLKDLDISIAKRRETLSSLEATITARQKDHDDVLSSIASLKNRLGAA